MAGAVEGEPRKVAQCPFCRGPSQCSLGVSASALYTPTPPPFSKGLPFFFPSAAAEMTVVLLWCHGAAPGLRGENS